jgi:hypothetical protein
MCALPPPFGNCTAFSFIDVILKCLFQEVVEVCKIDQFIITEQYIHPGYFGAEGEKAVANQF